MNENTFIQLEEEKKENVQNKLGFHSFEEVKEQYNNAVDLSDSKTYSAEITKLVSNAEYEKEIVNKDINKVDVEKLKYFSVPVWINNRAYNVLLECGQLKEKTSDSATRKGASNDTFTEVSKEKYIRKHGKLQVLDISYLYNIKNRPLNNKNQINNDNSKFNQLASEYNTLLKEFDENINDYNTLLSAYNKVQEENRILKNQNNSQER